MKGHSAVYWDRVFRAYCEEQQRLNSEEFTADRCSCDTCQYTLETEEESLEEVLYREQIKQTVVYILEGVRDGADLQMMAKRLGISKDLLVLFVSAVWQMHAYGTTYH
jgi:hypothetical protein